MEIPFQIEYEIWKQKFAQTHFDLTLLKNHKTYSNNIGSNKIQISEFFTKNKLNFTQCILLGNVNKLAKIDLQIELEFLGENAYNVSIGDFLLNINDPRKSMCVWEGRFFTLPNFLEKSWT